MGREGSGWAPSVSVNAFGSLRILGEILGLDPKSHALRMAGRSLVSAYDEATIYWLNNDEPFSVDVMVDYMIQLGVSALRSAATLDPTIDITSALETLLDAGNN